MMKPSCTFRSPLRPLACAAVASLLLLATAALAQATPQPGAEPPPKGKVLFERHEQPAVEDPAPSETPVATPVPVGNTGSSSSNRKAATLRRRAAAAAAGDEAQEAPPVETSSSTSTGDEARDAIPLMRLTSTDMDGAKQVPEAARRAVHISATDLDLHLNSHTGVAEARAQIVVRNTGSDPLLIVPLRISGALQWESARLQGSSAVLPLQQHHVADDLDHTGFATELALTLPQPLAPGAAASLDLYYGGTIAASAERLLALGAPAGRAALTDWDTVSDTFTGLRGLGDVLWYPVSVPPARLRDGNAVSQAVENSRTADADSSFRLQLTLEYTGSRPDTAFFCAERKPLQPVGEANSDGGVVSAEWTRTTLGPHTPSLFIASGAPQAVASGTVRVVTDRADTAAALGEAAARVRPMLAEWLGVAPERALDVMDLPVPGAAGFSDASLLVAPLTTGPAKALARSLVQPLANVWMPPGVTTPWLRDGLPAFLQAVYAERTDGRATAMAGLATMARALQVQAAPAAVPVSSSSSSVDAAPMPHASLATCVDAACARSKAAYVFEMLRGMLGDAALQQALSGWRVQMEQPHTAADETTALERLLQQTAGTRDLHWFFSNWIDADHGLPELSIVTVAPRKVERVVPQANYLPQQRKPVAGPIGAEPVPLPGDPEERADRAAASSLGDRVGPAVGSWLVAVEVQNAGSADAEVPVTVRSGSLTNTLPLRVPAHGRATIRVPFEADPDEVLVNDGSVPEVRSSTHRRSVGSLAR